MVASFAGCISGGFLYVFMHTGSDSPINAPWIGLKRLVVPDPRVKKRAEEVVDHERMRTVMWVG